ncbi:acyl-CoA dehydrogenase family protein [Arthrobacter sp. W4I7]|uniref:acyl-CoA dehydrogenase family protein n=1 Tax=Arthrobacter sp. W4I7 TaxID=3042296 RepID=UPI002788772C|nr:acyl-CoA dehydrogenase family protein [Arthrobacter sp. W4I7]MDQ0691368.1 alkylation response protein AidB-like acyl-CoA dehydrogenase [Arthrobacter sp. W4I7]
MDRITTTDETPGLREAFAALLATYCRGEQIRSTDERFDKDLWSQLAELGWTSVGVSEETGGLGGGPSDVGAICWETGRVLGPTLLSLTVAAVTPTLAAAGASIQELLLEPIVTGAARASVALTGLGGVPGSAGLSASCTGDGNGYVINGSAAFVPDPDSADWIIVAARHEGGIGLFSVPTEKLGITMTPMTDLTRRLGTIELRDVRVDADHVIAEPDGERAYREILARTMYALIMESLGGMERVLEMTLDYASQRRQFNRPIGSFQVIKHALADIYRDLQTAAVSSILATRETASTTLRPESLFAIKADTADAFGAATATSLRIHGGIGYTWEHDLHLYLKRSEFNRAWFGTSSWCRENAFSAIAAPLVGP